MKVDSRESVNIHAKYVWVWFRYVLLLTPDPVHELVTRMAGHEFDGMQSKTLQQEDKWKDVKMDNETGAVSQSKAKEKEKEFLVSLFTL